MKGTDIHCYVEYRKRLPRNADHKSNPWISFNKVMNPHRNYVMFGVMANIRTKMGNFFPPRGLPQDAGFEVMNDMYFFIGGGHERNVSDEVADLMVADGAHVFTVEKTKDRYVSNPRYYAHSWLKTMEFAQCVDLYRRKHPNHPEVEYEAMLAAMKLFEKRGFESRIVFWFEEHEE